MKKIIASILAAFFVLLFPLSAYASTTESMLMYAAAEDYSVMPLVLYDEDIVNISYGFSIGDFQTDNYKHSSIVSQSYDANLRFDASSSPLVGPWLGLSSLSSYANTYMVSMDLTSSDDIDDFIYYPLLGLDFNINGLYFNSFFHNSSNNHYEQSFVYSSVKPFYALVEARDANNSLITRKEINLNNFIINGNTTSFSFQLPKDSSYLDGCKSLTIELYYDFVNVPTLPFTGTGGNFGFRASDSFIVGNFINIDSSGSNDNYNQNVEAELGNIQTGINNVINSVVQMGNQAWQGAQQTVQAVTQMTQQLNTAIDQQRQDILDGLGLLGDDITGTLSNVKTEITNMGTSITNKLESTTETITNTIENKVDEVTTAVEDVKQSVTEVKQSILDLPNKIQEMLLGLIVPDSDTMADKYSEFSGLLEQKLGVIYQIPMMLFDFFDTIVNAATTPQTTLTLPAFQLPWIDGTTLTVWQPMEYKIIPEGMQVLSDLIKTITSMTVVVLTFNSVKRAYERFLRS